MTRFSSGEVQLNYDCRGSGPAVVMLHGFGMTGQLCWIETGWARFLETVGFRAIVLDSRGHGLSDRPADALAYRAESMTADVINLLDHLAVERAHLIGHSMGARTAFDVALKHPHRLSSLITVSLGSNLFEAVEPAALIRAFRGSDIATVPSAIRQTAETLLSIGNSREALVACLSAPRPVPDIHELAAIGQPVMLACGDKDAIVGDPVAVAAALPNAEAHLFAGFEHTDILGSEDLQALAVQFLRAACIGSEEI